MKPLKILSALFILFIAITFSGCTKLDCRGNISEPGVAFTFDDSYIDDWYKMLPLMDSFHVKATFYISNYNWFTPEQKQKLKELQAHGNEIAYHTTNHYNLNDYLKNGSMNVLMEKEIYAGLEKMRKDGFNPTTFAYPFGKHNDALDNKLTGCFKSVRALNGTNNYAKSMATGNKNKILYGLGIDESSKRPFDVLLKLLHNAYNDKACLVLVAHHVDRPELTIQLPLDKLRKLIQEAASTGLKFYTVSEISQ